ncbi:MAG TPA: phytanoyl-CoA dioxygenase family protein [Caulobacteraceae bacterium]|nr:phytanoyl-CoA dioxygenase family protein [Caulobacteraceae bacterium]
MDAGAAGALWRPRPRRRLLRHAHRTVRGAARRLLRRSRLGSAAVRPRPLLAFPGPPGRTWNVPRRAWHLDGVEGKAWPDYLRIFAMLAPLEARGGGTAFVTGSHRLAREIIADMYRRSAGSADVRSASVIRQMRRECAWIHGLYDESPAEERIERFEKVGGEHRGVSMRVDEMIGQTGDVILWHPDLLHATARNCRAQPRLALNLTVFATGMTPDWAKAAGAPASGERPR